MADRRTSGVYPLDELDDFKVADEDVDPRGWSVYSQDGYKLGEVKDLLVDVAAMKVRYLDVELDRGAGSADRESRHVLFPVGTARLDDRDDRVFVNTTATSVGVLPAYAGGGPVSRDYENSVRRGFVTAAGTTAGTDAEAGEITAAELDYYNHDHYDTDHFYGTRRQGGRRASDVAGGDDEPRMTPSEEEPRAGRHSTDAGDVGVRKTAETEHVRESVPLTREEVTVDRRPLATDARAAAPGIGEQEVRMPVRAEEAVVEKRPVVREEIVIRKRAVVENQAVDADLRRERVEIDRDVSGTAGAGGTARTVADRVVDAADDVKDRVDGNPASRPGPDPTDRRR